MLLKNQTFKQTNGKRKWNLVNLKALEGLVKVREYGVTKYKEDNGWAKVPTKDYFEAMKRHIVEMDANGIFSKDTESGLYHVWHVLCNCYFITYKLMLIELIGNKEKA